MNTSQPKRKGFFFGLGCFAILLVSPFLLYYGYCWGLWGQQSLLLQYIFQCNCPAANTEARYPGSVEVIVPACDYVYSMLSPSGLLLSVREKDSETTSLYLLDLQTGEKIPSPLSEKGGFNYLTDNLLYVSFSYEENYIVDRKTGDRYPIQRFSALHPEAMEAGNANLILLAEALRQAKYIFFRDYDDTIVALDPDFPASSEKNFITGWFDLSVRDSKQIEQFLIENNIVYQTILPDFPHEAISPDGRFVARYDGIYMVETNQKIVDGYKFSWFYRLYSGRYFSVRGWKYDNSGAIYSQFIGPCLLEPPGLDGPGCIWEVPQPVILLKVPEEYLSST